MTAKSESSEADPRTWTPGGESEAARRLRERLEAVTAEARAMSRVLPRAVTISTRDGGLAEAMAPAVERALTLNGRRNPRTLSDALVPAMGRAARQAVLASIRRSFLALNRFMLKYVSVQGLRWRLEAARAHRRYAEVFDAHTRSLPVKQVFLIHRETGILLQQAQSQIDATQDWDVVSGMLTAIGDFIHDSFSVGREEHLEAIRVGNVRIVIEQGPHAALAGLVHGTVPADLRDRFRSALDRIHAEFGRELETFDGETAVFDRSRGMLESCLQALVSTDRMHLLPQTWLVAALPVLAAGAALVLGTREPRRWRGAVADLREQPAIVVIEAGRRDGRYFIHGLRDPMSTDPAKVFLAHGFAPGDMDSRWAPYRALDRSLTLPRIRELLAPPESITLELDGGMLVIRGAASQEWADNAIMRLKGLTGLTGYRADGMVVSDQADYRRWERFVRQLEGEPGILVVHAGREDGRFNLVGLRDPLARDPNALLTQSGIPPGEVDARWQMIQSLDPAIMLQRARLALMPPKDVTLDLRDGILFAEGRAPYRWIRNAEAIAPALAGVRTFNTDRLVDTDLQALSALRAQVESEVFRFLVGAPDLWPGQGARIEALVEKIAQLRQAARARDLTVTVEIQGHTEPSGDAMRDASASFELASAFYEMLSFRGVDMSVFTRRGLGTEPPRQDDASSREANNRLVSFSVRLDGA